MHIRKLLSPLAEHLLKVEKQQSEKMLEDICEKMFDQRVKAAWQSSLK